MSPQPHREGYSSSRHTANRSIPNGQLLQQNIAQNMSGMGGGRPLDQKSAFVFPRSSRRVVLHLRAWSNLLKELHSNVDSSVMSKERARSRPWIRSKEPKESGNWFLWNLHSPTKDGEAKSHVLHLAYIALADLYGMNKKNITLPNHKNLINERMEKGHIKSSKSPAQCGMRSFPAAPLAVWYLAHSRNSK